jgi:hypothetical protein
VNSKEYLNRRGASEFLKDKGFPVAVATLAKLACIGGGPLMQKFGRRVLYRPQDLDSWSRSRLEARRNTSVVESAIGATPVEE